MVLWILLAGLAVMIIAAAVQLIAVAMGTEAFAATPSIRGPPYDATEKIRIYNMVRNRAATRSPDGTFATLNYQTILMDRAKSLNPDLVRLMGLSATAKAALSPAEKTTLAGAERKLMETAGGLVSPAIESFFTTVFAPATVPITPANIDTFMAGRMSDLKDIEAHILTTYFIGQSGVGSSERTGYAATLAGLGQGTGFLVGSNPGLTSTGAPLPGAGGVSTRPTTTTAAGTPPPPVSTATGTMRMIAGTPVAGLGGPAAAAPSTTTTATGTPVAGVGGPASGSATGARSAAGPQNPLFGPPFTSLNEGPSPSGGDSSLFTSYPQVFGGVAGATPSGPLSGPLSGALPGAMPTAGSAGATAESQFFPFSRSPGDMEVIPDPFRVSQTFSASNYSSKTDPVPFLADFSAFQS